MYDGGNEEHAHNLLAQTNSNSTNASLNPSPASFTPFARSMPNNVPPWVAPGVEMAMSQPLQSELNVEQFNMQEQPEAESSFDYGGALRNNTSSGGSQGGLATSVPTASGRPGDLPSNICSQLAQSLSSSGSRDFKSKYHTLPGISGPGLYQASEENYHPQYGLLPRRVRKTSFDHTVRPVVEQDDSNNMHNNRKRPAEASPHNRGGTHRPLPGPGEFPTSAFTFNYDSYGSLLDMGGGEDGGGAGVDSGSAALHNGNWSGVAEGDPSGSIDPSMLTNLQADPSGQDNNSFDFQQLMHLYLEGQGSMPFTTINPSDVLGRVPPVADYSPAVSPPPNGEMSIPQPRHGSTSNGERSGPVRSNSSPNLQGLKMSSASGSKSHSRQQSISGPSRSSKGKSGHSTPVSERNDPLGDGEGATTCTNCNTNNTPLWRRDPEGLPLCNACGLFYKLHGVVRPLSLKTDVIKKRNRGAPSKESGSRKSGAKSRNAKATSPAAERTSAPGTSISKRQRRTSDAPDSGSTSLASSLGTGGLTMTTRYD